ncbi:MAG TPA: chromate resistance protein ChrB domain-containing protein [Acetobacteraceae bacterium]|nr:chromate resistance protein ChrB domain-containing protein [Acetobacteraceae bacterium]
MITKSRADEPAAWLLLLHQLPARPAYTRVKLWRRLQALGAIAVKNAVYALPAGPQAQEDFEWVLKEIGEGGGEGLIVEARLIDGLTDDAARALFNTAREADYRALAKEIRAIEKEASPTQVARLRAEAKRIATIDFFGANGREDVEARLAALSAGGAATGAAPRSLVPERGQVWVTRRDVHVDRIGSAWLIRRFIDTEAVFKFVPAKGYRPCKGEIRFDMFDAEYTHEGDRCTFEVLLQRSGRDDPALTAISEIVHDIDLKDGKFARVEAGGIAALIDGLARADLTDMERVEQGGQLFDNLYALFGDRRR